MRPKKLNKKLLLNKNTVAHLNGEQLQEVQGGGYTDWPQVATCNYDSCDPSFCITCGTCRPPCIIP